MAKDLNKTVVYSALEVANICGVVNQTAINWIRNGHLKAFSTPGGQYRVYRDDLIVFMQNRGMRMPDDFLAIIADNEKSQNSIVIVDDDRGLNNVLKMYLEKIFPDIHFFQAFDGFEAGALLMEKKPFCVLLDLNLPGVNGLELCARLKQQEMYSHLTGFTKTDKKNNAAQFTYENKFLIKNGVFRPLSFVCEDVDSTGLENAVKAKAGQMFVNCCSYELTVYGCQDKDGDIFTKGMSVSVYAPSAMIYRETKFQVQELEIKRSDTEGVQTTFKLMLPDSINGTVPNVLPWEESE